MTTGSRAINVCAQKHAHQLGAGGKPSTWWPPGRLVEHNQHPGAVAKHRDAHTVIYNRPTKPMKTNDPSEPKNCMTRTIEKHSPTTIDNRKANTTCTISTLSETTKATSEKYSKTHNLQSRFNDATSQKAKSWKRTWCPKIGTWMFNDRHQQMIWNCPPTGKTRNVQLWLTSNSLTWERIKTT